MIRTSLVVIVSTIACGGSVNSDPALDDAEVDASMDATPDTTTISDTAIDTYFCCEHPPFVTDSSPLEMTATPTFVQAPGEYTCEVRVELQCAAPGAVIYYTTDGTTPNVSSPKYTGAILVRRETTIKAFAIAPSFAPSEVAVASYRISVPAGTTSPVSFSPSGGVYDSPVTVTLFTPSFSAIICFTTDGTPPTCEVESGVNCTERRPNTHHR